MRPAAAAPIEQVEQIGRQRPAQPRARVTPARQVNADVIDARVPTKLAVHLVVDNYAAHKRPKVLEWLTHHPRFVFHFTPTSASWLNAVEGLFALLSKRRLKRGVFRSLQELKNAIHIFIADTNANSKPFVWTKTRTRSSPLSNEGTKC